MSTVTERLAGQTHRLSSAAIGLVLVGLLAALGRLVGSLQLAVQRPEFALTYTGGVLSWLVTHPTEWYAAMSEAPHVPTIYTPLGMTVASWLSALAPAPIALRVLGFVSIVATTGIIAYTAWRVTGHRIATVVASGLYFLSPAVTRSTVLSRLDHFGILFGVAAVAAVIISVHDSRGRRLQAATIAGVACVAALLVKQSLVVFPAAILVAYLADREYALARRFVNVGVITAAPPIIGLTLLTDGRFWIHTLIVNAANPIAVPRAVMQLSWAAYSHFLLVAAALAVYHYRDTISRDMPTLVPMFVTVSLLVTVATIGKQGSWVGYAYPLFIAGAFALAYIVAHHVPDVQPDWSYTVDTRALVVLLLVATQLVVFAAWAPSTVTQPDNQQRVADVVAEADGPVLSEDASLLVATDSPEAFEPLVMKYAASNGVWDQGRVVERIRDREFAVIVTWENLVYSDVGDGRWSEQQKGAILGHYELRETIGTYHVYVPEGGA